ncbi:cytochrome C assembly family protein [Rhodoferax aquaticus]|uniref:Cytochrome C assembly protein n=1 Tax=Rhodoferax aquaticus TaxID=2527691 RepID=A0A515ELW6_9BURK|nr:cytochrome c biogenesis protein CcsA [Rhodoferax aquaticus]QDL53641.1 cytochrome C assembly protein [Rhodoferax aquaticus]
MILASAPPTQLILSVLASAAYAWPAVRAAHMGPVSARKWVWAAWALHGAVLSWSLLGDAPRFGFAPALSMTAWLVAAVYAVEAHIFPQLQTRWALCGLGAVAVVLSALFPGHAMASSASGWLPLHLAFGVACYGLFGTAVVHAWFLTRAEHRIRLAEDPHSGLPLLTLERLTFRFVGSGFAVLSATLLVGFVFGEAVYGQAKAWRWDHKTVFSVLSWLTFAVLLLGRRAFGWRSKRAVNMLYVGSVFLLLAYVGSQFVMEVLLRRTP